MSSPWTRWRCLAVVLVLLLPGLARAQEPELCARRCHAAKHSIMRALVRAWGAEAVQARDASRYRIAKRAYERYLEQFPSGPDHYAMQYAYADLLWRMAGHAARSGAAAERRRAPEYFREAHEQFVRTLELDPEGEFTVAAAWWQIEALRNHLRYREPSVGKQACELEVWGACRQTVDYAPIEYSAAAAQMLAAYDTYAKYVKNPEVEELPGILLSRARLLIHHHRFDEAEQALSQLVETFAEVDSASELVAAAEVALLDVLTVQWLLADSPQRVLDRSDALEAWALRGGGSQLLVAVPWRRGLAHRELGEFTQCAARFIDLVERFDVHSEAPTMLWNAAECLATGSHDNEAVAVLETLLVRHPDSEHVPPTMLQLAASHQALAHHEVAARWYETFAEGYLTDERADEALENAYLLRLGLGQAEQAQADLRRFERLYRRNDVGRAAKLFWLQHELLDGDEARRAHAVEYLESYGHQGGLDRAIVAEAVIGQIDWRRSCSEPLLHDSCITIIRERGSTLALVARMKMAIASYTLLQAWEQHKHYTPVERCGLATQGIVRVHNRDPELAKAAQARFEKVLALARKAQPPADDPERLANFRAAWGMASVYAIDQRYEQWLRLELPEDLDFFVEEWLNDPAVPSWYETWRAQDARRDASLARLEKFLARKRRQADDLQARYAEVDETESAAWMIAAAARTAAIHQHMADQLLRARVPQSFTDPDRMWGYCDELEYRARPMREQAIVAYRACLARASELSYINEFSRMCEDELQQLDGTVSPATNELFGEPTFAGGRIEPVGVLAEP